MRGFSPDPPPTGPDYLIHAVWVALAAAFLLAPLLHPSPSPAGGEGEYPWICLNGVRTPPPSPHFPQAELLLPPAFHSAAQGGGVRRLQPGVALHQGEGRLARFRQDLVVAQDIADPKLRQAPLTLYLA